MTKWNKMAVAATIDHAALKPTMTDEDIVAECELGKKLQVASVCVRPSDVALATKQLIGSGVVPSMVVGFPHGTNRPEVKALEAKLAIEDGAKELDMVMNIGKFLSGDHDHVRKDIEAVVAEARKTPGVIVKVTSLSGNADPYIIPYDHPGNQAARTVLKSIYNKGPYTAWMGGTIPICGTLLKVLKAHTVGFAFGLEDENIHAPNEFFRLSSFERGQKAYCLMLDQLSRLADRPARL